jgi:hypothetical protein
VKERLPFVLAGGVAAAAVLAAAVAFLGPRYGSGVAAGAGLGLGLGAAATLLAFAWVLRASRRGSRQLFKLFGIGFLAKLLLLAGGTLAGHFAGLYDPAAYAVGFAGGFALAAAGGIAEIQRGASRGERRP